MFGQLEAQLLTLVHTLPLEAFVLIASFIEEVIAPIPSPTVMVISGTVAQVQHYPLSGLFILALIGALGKTIGACVVYFITNKAEHVIMGSFGKFFGVTHEDVENLGKKLGNGFKDYILLTTFRALPFMPSVVVSVGSGLLKVPLKLFITTTFVGTIVRDGFYLYAGYVGAEALAMIINKSTNIETYIEILVVVAMLGYIGYRVHERKKSSSIPKA